MLMQFARLNDEKLMPVEGLTQTERTATVYNLRVKEDHTFFVGDGTWGFSVWVHNAYSVIPAPKGKSFVVVNDAGEVVRSAGAMTRIEATQLAGWLSTPETERSIWSLPDRLRGFEIELRLGGRTGLNDSFQAIDQFDSGVATSIKSVNLLEQGYTKNPQQVAARVQRYIKELAVFAKRGDETYAGITIAQSEVKRRVLAIVVPQATPEQQAALNALVAYGARLGVVVDVITILK
jgi:hypothetical protein